MSKKATKTPSSGKSKDAKLVRMECRQLGNGEQLCAMKKTSRSELAESLAMQHLGFGGNSGCAPCGSGMGSGYIPEMGLGMGLGMGMGMSALCGPQQYDPVSSFYGGGHPCPERYGMRPHHVGLLESALGETHSHHDSTFDRMRACDAASAFIQVAGVSGGVSPATFFGNQGLSISSTESATTPFGALWRPQSYLDPGMRAFASGLPSATNPPAGVIRVEKKITLEPWTSTTPTTMSTSDDIVVRTSSHGATMTYAQPSAEERQRAKVNPETIRQIMTRMEKGGFSSIDDAKRFAMSHQREFKSKPSVGYDSNMRPIYPKMSYLRVVHYEDIGRICVEFKPDFIDEIVKEISEKWNRAMDGDTEFLTRNAIINQQKKVLISRARGENSGKWFELAFGTPAFSIDDPMVYKSVAV
jgi:hypothetical protein